MIRQEIKNLIEKAIKELQKEGVFNKFEMPEIKVENPEEETHGHYSTNVAFKIAKLLKENPLKIAEKISNKVIGSALSDLSIKNIKVLVADSFINIYLPDDYLQEQVEKILKQKDKFGELKIGKGQKINVEFISANPTGPLHIGNARGGFCGDVLANVLEKAGYKAFREYYVNDMGRQILFLENSLNDKEPLYKNPYVDELKEKGIKDVKKAVKDIVGKINKTTERMGIRFDKWFYESDLEKEKEKALKIFEKKELTYEKEKALWFKSTEFGDDKDRVLKRSEEKTTYSEDTYILSDSAYMINKFERGFDCLIIFLGAEHYGYIARLKAAAKALDFDPENLRPIIMQLVRLIEEGKELKMSKRTGAYITIDELIDEVGIDVSRFFFLIRSPGSHLVFDMDLAKEQSEKNPVFYIQYAYARICSILRKAEGYKSKGDYKLLNDTSELDLIKQMIRFHEIIEDTAKDYQVQRIPQYALDLVTAFHKFYEKCRVIDEKNPKLTEARLALVKVTQIVLKNTLDLMGISAPEKM